MSPTPPSQSYPVLPAERKNHAREMVRVEELGCWDALVVMSGDGLMYEVRPVPGGCEGGGAGVFPRLRPCAPTGDKWAHGSA